MALALLLALPLQAGMAMPMVDHSNAAAMAMPDGDAAMPSCDGCGGDDGADMTMGACVAFCGSMLALASGLIILPMLPVDLPASAAIIGEPGRAGPPDPHPPRPVVLT